MKKYFYSHLVQTEMVHLDIDELSIEEHEKKHLKKLVERNVHYVVLDTVMSQLSEEDKKTFLKHSAASSHKTTWDFLKAKTEDMERKIFYAADKILKEFSNDIASVKK